MNRSVRTVLTRASAALLAMGLTCPVSAAEPTQLPPVEQAAATKTTTVSLADGIKKPFPGFDWGFDFRLRYEWYEKSQTLSEGYANNELGYFRFRPRIWVSLAPIEQVRFNARLISEPRYYLRPAASEGWTYQEGLLDQFNLQITNVPMQGLSLTVGRQDLAFGNKWLIFDATSTDGTRTEFFDAARLRFDAREIKTSFDAIYVLQYADSDHWLPVINDQNRPISEQDERTGIFYVSNKSLPRTQLDGYVMYRDQSDPVSARGNVGYTWVAGARVQGEVGKRWEYRAEVAPEWGELNGHDLRAWGFNSLVTYNAGGSWRHKFRAGYEFLTGDDPNTETNEGWDPMYGRRALWSELAVVLFGLESRGRAADYKNLQRPSVGWSAKPLAWLDLSVDYMPLFANENTLAGTAGYSEDGKFRGQLAQAIARFTINRYWSGLLWGEAFLPGNYYSANRQETAYFIRTELMFKF
jgi:hypothetical protein